MSDFARLRRQDQSNAEECLRRAGYARGGAISDDAEDRKIAAAAVHAHERHDHRGEPLTKLKRGGRVDGEKAGERLDKRARGGRLKHGGPTKVNVIVASGGGDADKQMAFQQGAQTGARAVASKLAAAGGVPRPPMPPPGAPGMPPGGAPMPQHPPMPPPGAAPMPPRPPGMMKRGGAVTLHAGAGSGLGRLEKIRAESRPPTRVKEHLRFKARG